MFPIVMSNSTSVYEKGNTSSVNRVRDIDSLMNPMLQNSQEPQKTDKTRNLLGDPVPKVVVIALSPESIMAKSRFFCEICNKGFSRDQNLQLHRRGHNLPWKLKKRNDNELIQKKAYICPVETCVHHQRSNAICDLTGIRKHYFRKHGEKKWKCDKCSKSYAVQSDLKAHSKTCVIKEYRSDCGIIFSRRDNLINHMRFCDASIEQSARLTAASTNPNYITTTLPTFHSDRQILSLPPPLCRYQPISRVPPPRQNPNIRYLMTPLSWILPPLPGTALFHSVETSHISSTVDMSVTSSRLKNDGFTRDFLGLMSERNNGGGSADGGSARETELHDIIQGRHGI